MAKQVTERQPLITTYPDHGSVHTGKGCSSAYLTETFGKQRQELTLTFQGENGQQYSYQCYRRQSHLFSSDEWGCTNNNLEQFGVLCCCIGAYTDPDSAVTRELYDKINATDIRVLYQAAIKGDDQTVKEYLDTGKNVQIRSTSDNFPEEFALKANQSLKHKSQSDLDKFRKGQTALHYAAHYGHTQVAQQLLDVKINIDVVNNEGHTPLSLAVQNGHAELAKVLIEKGAKVHHLVNGQSLLALALEYDNGQFPRSFAMSTLLLDKGVKVDIKDGEGKTALMHQAIADNAEAVRFLLQRGAKICMIDNENCTVLHWVMKARRDDVSMVRVIFDNAADQMNNHDTKYELAYVLSYAASGGDTKILNYLLQNKVSQFLPTNPSFPSRALLYTAKNRRPEICQQLMREITTETMPQRVNGDYQQFVKYLKKEGMDAAWLTFNSQFGTQVRTLLFNVQTS